MHKTRFYKQLTIQALCLSQLALPGFAESAPVSSPQLQQAPPTAAPPADAYSKIATYQPVNVESVKSPDGQYCVNVVYEPYQRTRITLSESSDCSKVFEIVFPWRISSVQWLADNQTVVFLGHAHSTSPVHLFSCNGKRKLARDLTPFGSRSVDKFWLSKNRKVLIASINLNENTLYERFLIDTSSGALEPLGSRRRFGGVSVDEQDTLVTTAEWPKISVPKIIYQVTSNPTRVNGPTRVFPFATGTLVSGPAQVQTPVTAPIRLSMPGQDKFKKLWTGDIDQRLNVLDPTPQLEKETEIKLKPWTPEERIQVRTMWRQICDQLPGFAMRACHERKVSMIRVGQFKSSGGELALGVAIPKGMIILTDSFFTENRNMQLDTMVHELAHECDNYGSLSRSREWLSLVRENIQACRAAKAYSKKHGLIPLDDQGAGYFGLPRIYAAEAVSECLATWTSAVAHGRKAPAGIERFLAEKVANPCCEEEEIDKLVLSSCDDCAAGRYQDSILKLREVLHLRPGSMPAWHFLELSYSKTHNLRMALIASNKLLSLAAEVRLPEDPYFKLEMSEYYYQHACLLKEAKDISNARKYASRALALAPKEKMLIDFERNLRKASLRS